MDFETGINASAKLLAFLLGLAICFDRERHGKDTGLRTYAAVCMGAALFTPIGAHLRDVAAVSRIIANVTTGVGFLDAGIIYHGSQSSHGLTTAATVCGTSAVGVAMGLEMFVISIASTAALYLLLSLHDQPWNVRWKTALPARPANAPIIPNHVGLP